MESQHSKAWVRNSVVQDNGKTKYYRDLVVELGYDPIHGKRSRKAKRSQNVLEDIQANNERVGAEILAKLTQLQKQLAECQQMLEELNRIDWVCRSLRLSFPIFTKRRLERQKLVLVEATKALGILLKTVKAFEKLEYLHPYWVGVEESLETIITDYEARPSYGDWT